MSPFDSHLARTDIGNISDVQVNFTSHLRSYSNAHELTSVSGNSQTFDDDGNQTLTHTGTTLSWNDANRLSGTTLGTVTSTYKYDSDNKRVSKKVVDGATTTEDTVYVYAGPNCIAEYQLGTAAASPDQEYVYADRIDSLVLLARNNNANRYVVTRNQQWSVTALADAANGNVQERYAYDQFGNRTIFDPDGVTVRASSSYNMPYGFTSRRHDDESELMYFRARYYDPSTGEFASKDPLEYVDGFSMMRAYIGLDAYDAHGTSVKSIIECHDEYDLCNLGANDELQTCLSQDLGIDFCYRAYYRRRAICDANFNLCVEEAVNHHELNEARCAVCFYVIAGVLIAIDGPLPVGDSLALGTIVCMSGPPLDTRRPSSLGPPPFIMLPID